MLTLKSTPGNPVPPGATLVPVRTADGLTLRAAYWRPLTRIEKGTVCLLQGRAEFIERYSETVAELRRRAPMGLRRKIWQAPRKLRRRCGRGATSCLRVVAWPRVAGVPLLRWGFRHPSRRSRLP
jgi:hypothetical protein